MVSEQSCYEGNGLRRGEEVPLHQAVGHDSEEKCRVHAYTRVSILEMEGNKDYYKNRI